ncbi:MAG: ATP-binding protein [Candidatus Falkowbacteria bacterium]
MPIEKLGFKSESLGQAVEKKKEKQNDPIASFLQRFDQEKGNESASVAKMDWSHLNPAQQAESMWSVFQDAKHETAMLNTKKDQPQDTKRLRLSLDILKKLHDNPIVKETYLAAQEKQIKEIASINGNFEKYKILQREIGQYEATQADQEKRMFSQRGTGLNEVDLLLFEANERQLEEKRQELSVLSESDPELSALAQYESLKTYSKQLKQESFIWTPSRQELLAEMEEAAFSGQPVLLSGESGTGKTRLVEQTAKKLTGRINNQTPGKDVRFQDLIAKPKISQSGETYYEYKEIGEAATGRSFSSQDKPEHTGRIVADDEFNLLPESEQTERLARIAAWTPGKKIRMPVTNQEVEIADNFLYCAMVNLASERYSRKKIPPEVLRKFAKVNVDYPRQQEKEPEIYEMMLAALLDSNGRVRAAKEEIAPDFDFKEINKTADDDGAQINRVVRKRELVTSKKDDKGNTVSAGGFLWRLSNALNEINKSFSRKKTVLETKGEAQYLKDMIIDIGTILGWMKEYSSLNRNKGLEEFFCEKINKQFLSRQEYTEDDRALVKEFLNHYAINVDQKPAERQKKEFEILTPLEIGLLSPRVNYEKVVYEEPVLAESYYVAPDGKRIKFRLEKFGQGENERRPGQVYYDGEKKAAVEFMGVNSETGEPIYQPYKPKKTEKREDKTPSVAKAEWKNPETQTEQEIEIDLEKNLAEQAAFYRDNLNLVINEEKVRNIWKNNYTEIKAEMSKYGYDSILIVPDNLPNATTLNQKLIETMEENTGAKKKKKVAATWQSDNFKEGGAFAGVKNSYEPSYRIVLTHGAQNLADHPILKATRGMSIVAATGLANKDHVMQAIADGNELPIDCELEINGQKISLEASGLSLEEYMIMQRQYFNKNQKHLDEDGWIWLTKSGSGSRVVRARWLPGGRQLDVHASDPSDSYGTLGLRLSRSFS